MRAWRNHEVNIDRAELENDYKQYLAEHKDKLVSVLLSLENWAFVHAFLITTYTHSDLCDEATIPTIAIECCCQEKFAQTTPMFKVHRDGLGQTKTARLRRLVKVFYDADYCGFFDLLGAAHEIEKEKGVAFEEETDRIIASSQPS
jgi:hypothetical protein